MPLLTVQVEHAIAAQGDRMQWIEGRLAAARHITEYLTSYPVSHTVRQIGWLADTLQLDPATVTFELVAGYRTRSAAPSPNNNGMAARPASSLPLTHSMPMER